MQCLYNDFGWMDTRRIEHRSSWAWFERGRHDFVGKRAAGGQKEWRRVERSAEDDTEPFGRACGVRLCRVSCVECRMCGWCGRDEKGRAGVACGGACTAVCSAMAQSMRCERFHTRICTITRSTLCTLLDTLKHTFFASRHSTFTPRIRASLSPPVHSSPILSLRRSTQQYGHHPHYHTLHENCEHSPKAFTIAYENDE